MSSLWQSVKAEILYQVNQVRPFIAIAGAYSGGRLPIRRVTEATAGSETYALLAGVRPQLTDEVICLVIGGKPVILGVLQRAPTSGSLYFWNTMQFGNTVTLQAPVTMNDSLLAQSSVEIDGELNHDGTTVGLFGVTPAVRPAAYTVTNLTTDRTYDANASSTAELADVLGTLIADLRTLGIVQ